MLDRLSTVRDTDSAVGQRNLKGFGYLAALLKLYDSSPSLTSSPQGGGIRGLSQSKDIQVLTACLIACPQVQPWSKKVFSAPEIAVESLDSQLHAQIDVLRAILDQFYEAHELEDGATKYLRSDQKKSLMLLFILVIVLILEGYTMDGLRSETLRQTLKLSAPQLGAMYRHDHTLLLLCIACSIDSASMLCSFNSNSLVQRAWVCDESRLWEQGKPCQGVHHNAAAADFPSQDASGVLPENQSGVEQAVEAVAEAAFESIGVCSMDDRMVLYIMRARMNELLKDMRVERMRRECDLNAAFRMPCVRNPTNNAHSNGLSFLLHAQQLDCP